MQLSRFGRGNLLMGVVVTVCCYSRVLALPSHSLETSETRTDSHAAVIESLKSVEPFNTNWTTIGNFTEIEQYYFKYFNETDLDNFTEAELYDANMTDIGDYTDKQAPSTCYTGRCRPPAVCCPGYRCHLWTFAPFFGGGGFCRRIHHGAAEPVQVQYWDGSKPIQIGTDAGLVTLSGVGDYDMDKNRHNNTTASGPGPAPAQ